MPDSSPDSFDAPTITTEAQSSLLRISRRHSLPASTTFSNIFSLWGNDNDPAAPTGRDHYNHQNNVNQQQQQQQQPSLNGAPRIVNGNGSGVGGNRHRYGHRHTRSAVVDQPVIVKSYNPGPASSSIASPIHEVRSIFVLSFSELSKEWNVDSLRRRMIWRSSCFHP